MEENTQKVEAMEPKKMSYEELENVARQLSEQTRQLYTKLQEMNMVNMFKRLDYLFKVAEFSHMFNSEFVTTCTQEIQDLLTVPEEKQEEKVEE
jgi:hypothetical protein